jgi:phosphomannomutase
VTRDLSSIVKAYDVRGLVPQELDADVARALGAAFARFVDAPRIVLARDMRTSGVELAAAFAEGVTGQGVDVVDAGLGSTDLLYFAAGTLDVPGAMFTASHNPARYNGIKLCLSGARPVGQDSGLRQLREDAERFLDEGLPASERPAGTVVQQDLLSAYAAHLRALVPGLEGMRPLRVVVDAGNGMAGHTVPAAFDGLPLETTAMYFELDGSFPNHEANPIDPANLVDLQAEVRRSGADVGLAFDGDADRCFVVDERGEPVDPSALTALIAARELGSTPGRRSSTTSSRRRRSRRSCASKAARRSAPASGTPSSRPRWPARARSSAASTPGTSTSPSSGTPTPACSPRCTPWPPSGARRPPVGAHGAVRALRRQRRDQLRGRRRARHARELRERYADLEQDELDGLTVRSPEGWWFNVRPSNTEPLLRLNVEAPDAAVLGRVRDEVLGVVRAGG